MEYAARLHLSLRADSAAVEFIAICRYKFTEKKNKKQNVNLIEVSLYYQTDRCKID